MKALVIAVLAMVAAPGISAAQEQMPWQSTVAGQIEAIRNGDGAEALSFAAKGFRDRFEGEPQAFLIAIEAAGYGPIADSRSYSFGTFELLGDNRAIQVVNFVHSNQSLYQALYQLTDEAGEGWRVEGVALRREAGVGI